MVEGRGGKTVSVGNPLPQRLLSNVHVIVSNINSAGNCHYFEMSPVTAFTVPVPPTPHQVWGLPFSWVGGGEGDGEGADGEGAGVTHFFFFL